MWDPKQYLKFEAERARPFHDLLAQVECKHPRFLADLGCGPGHLTRTLAERWPAACVLGIDSASRMIAEARQHVIQGRLAFVEADIAAWSPPEPLDLVVSNAVLQWLPDHAAVLRRMAEMLAPGGTLAVQVPNSFRTPAHLAIEATIADTRWSSLLSGVGLHRDSTMPAEWYVRTLRGLGFRVNAWETTYHHLLPGENAALEWYKGTALRPLLERLGAEQAGEFLTELGGRLQRLHPSDAGLTLFPFPRIFFVAQR